MDYPKIGDARDCPGGRCIAWEKLDGTNLGWEWERGAGFTRATTRRLPFDRTHPVFGEAIALFDATLRGPLDERLRAHPSLAGTSRAKAFTEFLGPSSFAGLHVPGEPKRLVLIDVWTEDRGLLGPFELLEVCAGLPLPRVVFQGRFSGALTVRVKEGALGVTEGVVVKGGRTGSVWMCKVKTDAWLARLAAAFEAGTWTDGAGIERSVKEERSALEERG